MTFQDLGLLPQIFDALRELGYEKPSPIQEKAIPPALRGRDVLGCAQTGTGKTCAFAAPILQQLYQRRYQKEPGQARDQKGPGQARPIRALILTPTRELALQIQESFEAYGKHLPLRSAVIFGGVGQQSQVDALQRGVDVLVATPGRLQDLHDQGFIHVEKLEIFVLDEADRMLDMGFIHDVKKILTWLPRKKQTLFFSATMPPEVQGLVNSLLVDPVRVAVDPVSSPVEVIDQKLYYVDRVNKSKLLAALIQEPGVKNALIFTRTKHGANKVAGDLTKGGIPAAAIHGNKSQTARVQALTDFKAGAIKALVATDIAARGIDIEELSHVFNYNLPDVPETYIHRIGRTGRAGRGGTAVSFCEFGEKELLGPIEKLLKKPIPVVENHPWPMENFEAPKRDKHGKLVNPDDAEARQAARELKKQRDEAKKAAEAKKAEPQKPAKEPGAASIPPSSKKSAPKQVPVPAPKAEKQPRKVQLKTGKAPQTGAAGKRASAGYKPSRTIDEALTAMQPRYTREEQAAETDRDAAFAAWLAEERAIQERMRRQDPLGGEVIMDATARLLAPKGSQVARPQAPRQVPPVRQDKAPQQTPPDKDAQARQAIMEARNGASTKKPPSPKKEPRPPRTTVGKGRSYAPKPKSEQPALAELPKKAPEVQKPASTWVNPNPSKNREDRARRKTERRGRPGEPPSWSAQKDSTEQSGTLMKPYYFIPDEEDD